MSPWLIVTGDLVSTGGMDRANLALATHLLDVGREVHLVAHRVDPALTERGARLHLVPKPIGSYSVGRPLLDVAGRLWALRLTRAGKASVVVNGGNCLVPSCVVWAHYVHAAYEPHLVGGLVRRLKLQHDRRVSLDRETRALERARLVIANSERTRRDLVARTPVASDRVRTIYYGSDPARFKPLEPDERQAVRRALGWPDDRPRMVFVGGLGDRRKGFDVLFRAQALLCEQRDWDVDLTVVGRGQELETFRDRAARARLARRVEFLGFRADVDRVLAAADLLVAPTRYEAYGLGVHEAICCGVPAIVSADAGVAERYPPALGSLLLTDPDSADELAARLRAWRAAPAALAGDVLELSERFRARTWSHMAAEIVACVEGTS